MDCVLCKSIQIFDESYEQNYIIESQISKSSIEEEKNLKILLLGSADSGKSTIVKQMRILHNQTFNEDEMLHFRAVIHKNLIESYHHIARGILQLEIPIPRLEKV
uniref:G-protein alpha subunit n=1 Tax=Acrobeloides nanus TaxID=290746 RepID=A0A914E629_9BILA